MTDDMPVNLTERPEDTARRYADYMVRIQEEVNQFPLARLKKVVPNPNYQGWLADVVVDLLRELRTFYHETYYQGVLDTEEQAPSVEYSEQSEFVSDIDTMSGSAAVTKGVEKYD
jgi:hypothetical protein